jgi:Skp family chaperone for outer membrane proteins
MEVMAQEWTEGRLDELSGKVDRGFEGVDRRFEQVDGRFERVEGRFEQVERRFEKVDADIRDLRLELKTEFAVMQADMKAIDGRTTERLDSIQRVMVQMMVALTAAILAGFAGIFALLAAAL